MRRMPRSKVDTRMLTTALWLRGAKAGKIALIIKRIDLNKLFIIQGVVPASTATTATTAIRCVGAK